MSGTILAWGTSGDSEIRYTLPPCAEAPLPLASQKDIALGLGLPPSLAAEPLQGGTYFRLLGPRFDHRRRAASERDRAGNRPWCYEQYASGLWLDVCNLIVTRWQGLPQTTTLAQGQERCGVPPPPGVPCVPQPPCLPPRCSLPA